MKQEKNKDFLKALEILAQFKDTSTTTKNQKKSVVNYKEVVEKEFRLLREVIKKLEEQNLTNVAKIQTMARRHLEEETKNLKYGAIKLAEDILKPIDLFKKVLKTPVQSEEVKNYLLGFEMIAKQLDQALIDNGIEKIEVQPGDDFDPRFHDANEAVETDKFAKGKIVEVISNGYKMYDRVVIHALVKVAK